MKLVFSIALLALAATAPRSGGDCDLAKIEKAYWCETCSEVRVKADLASNKTYYVCEDCGATQNKAGKCPDCDVELVKKTSGADVCGSCYEKPVACEACVKECWSCPSCEAMEAKSGKCEDCEVDRVKKVSRALVRYECAECGASSLTAGSCEGEDCSAKGKALSKVCTASGEFPHVTADK